MTRACVYVTGDWGIHDERWVEALNTVGFNPTTISMGRDGLSVAQLREAVLNAAGSYVPVLAGPLTTVTQPLSDLPIRIIGLSWGWDLHDAADRGDDLWWLANLAGVIVDSKANKKIAQLAGVPDERITFLPWGVDLATFTFPPPSIDVDTYGLPRGVPLVVTMRAHEARYRVADVLDAFARVVHDSSRVEGEASPQLVIGNTGSLTPALHARADALGITELVSWIGRVPESELPRLLGAATAYVTASEVDGTSVTLLQAMASGTPVIASDTVGNADWVTQAQTGFLFPVGDIDALAHQLSIVLRGDHHGVCQRARIRVEADADWTRNMRRLSSALH